MSTSDFLYVKNLGHNSETSADSDGDVWDDRKLNEAYEKALRIAEVEVAKRIAMSTNTKPGEKEETNKARNKSSNPSGSKQSSSHWKVGMPCRAIYEGDMLEYEAIITRIINDRECVVKFFVRRLRKPAGVITGTKDLTSNVFGEHHICSAEGYDNSEIVPINTLTPSLGKNEQIEQIKQVVEKDDEGFNSESHNADHNSDRIYTSDTAPSKSKKKKGSHHKNHAAPSHSFELPDLPFTIPNIRNMGSLDLPVVPPPMPMPLSDRIESEDQALSSMLLSWYMSGYYTGLYQGMKRSKENVKRE